MTLNQKAYFFDEIKFFNVYFLKNYDKILIISHFKIPKQDFKNFKI